MRSGRVRTTLLPQEITLRVRTMHMAVSIIDTFLSAEPIGKKQLQLVGTCAVALAGQQR